MPRRLILSALAIVPSFAAAPVATAQNAARLIRMADQLDAMDHAEFEDQITEVIRCIRARALTCADTGLAEATPLVTSPGDQATLNAVRIELANQRRTIANEEQAVRDRELADYRAAEAAKQAKWARADAEYNAAKAQMLAEQEASGAFSAGAQIQQELARNQESQARINDIHSQAMANIQRQAAARERQRADEARAEQYRQEAASASTPRASVPSAAGNGDRAANPKLYAYITDPRTLWFTGNSEAEARAKAEDERSNVNNRHLDVYDRGENGSSKVNSLGEIQCRDTDPNARTAHYRCEFTVTFDVRALSPKSVGPAVGITR